MVETPSTCTCEPPWPQLRADVPGRNLVAVASVTPGPLCALWTASCTGCGATYDGPWRLPPGEPPPRPTPPPRPVQDELF